MGNGGEAPRATGLGGSDCERIRPGPLAQPVNALSSLAYLGSAAALLTVLQRRGTAAMGHALAYCTALGLVGVGSVAFHGPQPRGARLAHDLPILATVAMIPAGPLVARRRGSPALPGWTQRRAGTVAVLLVAGAGAYRAGRTGAATCDPDSLLQWHAAWHALSAAALGLTGLVLLDGGGGDT